MPINPEVVKMKRNNCKARQKLPSGCDGCPERGHCGIVITKLEYMKPYQLTDLDIQNLTIPSKKACE